MNEKIKNLKDLTLTAGATTLLAAGVAAPAKASTQNGGTEASPTVTTQDGGILAPAATSQTLEDQAEQAEATVANSVIKLENGHNTSPAKSVPNVAGDALSETTVTVPAKDSKGKVDGKYRFDIITDNLGSNGPLQPGSVISVKATETAKGASVPEASVMIDQNPGTNTAEIGGTYQMTGSNGPAAKAQAFDSFSAEVQAVSPTAPIANSYEVSSTENQMLSLAQSAKAGAPIHPLQPVAEAPPSK
jgi:hypothetical protein